MRRLLLFSITIGVFLITFGADFLQAAEGDITYEFDSPGFLNRPRGLTIDSSGLLYCSGVSLIAQQVTPMLCVIDTLGGVSRGSFVIDYPENLGDELQPRGCAWDGENVWIADTGAINRLLCISPRDGSLVRSFLVSGRILGLAYSSGYLYGLVTASGGGTVLKYDPDGNAHGSFEIPSNVGGLSITQGFGLAPAAEGLYCSA
ncbi:hypothetical protein J7M28_08335, partial [bacterium]|nr:hypothetical protein [bacterium]